MRNLIFFMHTSLDGLIAGPNVEMNWIKVDIFGSPRASKSLLNEGLIDEFWLFVNPVILGKGVPLFKDMTGATNLKLVESITFGCGVIALRYGKL